MTLLDSLRYADTYISTIQGLIIIFFQQNFSAFKIHNIIKAGSLGHGTAVFGNFDVDLVIYSDSKQLNEMCTIKHYMYNIIVCRCEG